MIEVRIMFKKKENSHYDIYLSLLGYGTTWCGRRTVTADVQRGSNPLCPANKLCWSSFNWIEQVFCKHKVRGSNPFSGPKYLNDGEWCNWLTRWTLTPETSNACEGSSPSSLAIYLDYDFSEDHNLKLRLTE